ncbi:2OG-Fe(II) oxygenase [Bacillus cereus]|uniref:2OG-Fe(II) oxygenase n=1 Tax=Bacillus cereus TaxID=1396 RepID=UPI002AC0ED10|nr:2OG-Fe(II) oxygenase [Bacillus cereus]MDZ4481529.1 2OG-Fe(II) oxygenase [Bacillus cereus]MDZ4497373.1 2OG-Fe(II) oxygenase [Bacillus cereus]MDZ4519247.1 2OG-Fe(II) oxygenase [Bacillus cereus]MDZ4583431.1 2OG-Fe(II) oxygenase [Bacillus cereus]
MRFLNINSFTENTIETIPFKWGSINDSFTSKELALQLCAKFPKKNFTHSMKESSDKMYNMYNLPLITNNNIMISNQDNIDNAWLELAKELLSDTYREALGEFVGESLKSLKMDAIFWEYKKECWLDAHLDKKEKLVTQIFYFNEKWEDDWGGHLLILNSKNIKDLSHKMASFSNSSAIIYRDENSWHAVEKVSNTALESRKSLQVIFYKN